MKVRFKEATTSRLTKGKKYRVRSKWTNYYLIIDDEGNESKIYKECFDVVESKQLKVGDVLLAKDLDDWCQAGENYYIGVWVNSSCFLRNRIIEAIGIKDGHKAFRVSGTNNFWIKAKGFRKFCKR